MSFPRLLGDRRSWPSGREGSPGGSTKEVPDELREHAVRLYRESDPKPVIRHLAQQLGVHHEALRNWIRQDQADHGERTDRPTTAELEELRRLRKENTELRRANEILKATSAVFAQEMDPIRKKW